eukprot:1151515-Pelagomonas_calceolata.AAC.2
MNVVVYFSICYVGKLPWSGSITLERHGFKKHMSMMYNFLEEFKGFVESRYLKSSPQEPLGVYIRVCKRVIGGGVVGGVMAFWDPPPKKCLSGTQNVMCTTLSQCHMRMDVGCRGCGGKHAANHPRLPG